MSQISAVSPSPIHRFRDTAGAFVMLTKPRIIELLLITTVPTMIVAEGGLPSLWLIVLTVVGGTLAAGGANTFNMYIDRDIDRLMERRLGGSCDADRGCRLRHNLRFNSTAYLSTSWPRPRIDE